MSGAVTQLGAVGVQDVDIWLPLGPQAGASSFVSWANKLYPERYTREQANGLWLLLGLFVLLLLLRKR